MAKRSIILSLPIALRDELDAKLIANNFSRYAELEEWLAKKGHPAGKSSIHRYGAKLERKLQVWRAPVTADKKLDAKIKQELTRVEQAKIRHNTGVLVLVIDPATRETILYATAHNPVRTRELIEAALIKNSEGKQ